VHDPLELRDIAPGHSDIVSKMYKDYHAWFQDVSATRGYEPSPIELGGTRENPSVLTRQDWRGPLAGVEPNDLGFWHVQVVRASRFDVTLRFAPRKFPTVLHLSLNETHREQALPAGASAHTFENVTASARGGRLEAWVEGNRARAGVLDVLVQRIGD
jgi:hypothetical protein